jgi:ATP-dependent helicase IRC3
MIGRGMRLFPGKADCHIIDMVGVLKRGIATVPTLFGLDPDELVDELTVEQLQKLKEKREREAEKRRLELEAEQEEARERGEEEEGSGLEGMKISVQFTDYENVFDLLKDARESCGIRRLSQYTWVTISAGKHVLPLKAGRYLKIVRERDGL